MALPLPLQAQEAGDGVVVRSSGRIERRQGRARWQVVRQGERLEAGQSIRTLQSASVGIAFGASRLVLGPETELRLLESASSGHSLDVERGSFVIRGPAARWQVLFGRQAVHVAAQQDTGLHARFCVSGERLLLSLFEGTGRQRDAAFTAGTGVSLPRRGPLLGPEPLLQAPADPRPLPDELSSHANPRFSWLPVAGAHSYSIEICRDEECAERVDGASELQDVSWRPRGLPMLRLYWRVTARSADGLYGLSSEPRSITIESLWRRPEAPAR